MKNYSQEVLSVTQWTKNLFSFKIKRPNGFKFKSGEFVMIGLPDKDNKPILRAYSICSPNWDDVLEFYSIIVKNGPLTSRLKNIKAKDEIILMTKSTGTLILDALLPGKRLFLLSTGTGFAPFASIIREPEAYEKFQSIIVTHTCRNIRDLQYSKTIVNECNTNEILKEITQNRLIYYQTTTREKSLHYGRITERISKNLIFKDLNIKPINLDTDRVMICGSLDFNNEIKEMLINKKFFEGATNKPGTFVLEKAFVG